MEIKFIVNKKIFSEIKGNICLSTAYEVDILALDDTGGGQGCCSQGEPGHWSWLRWSSSLLALRLVPHGSFLLGLFFG